MPPLANVVVQPTRTAREHVWDGVIEAVADTTISAQTNARVLELPFDVGDRVARGDVLVRFSNVEQKSGQRAAAASVAAARAEVRDAEANWKRVEDVVGLGLMARAQLDAARARRDGARASLGVAEANLHSASQQADYTVARAPIDGVITRRLVEVGEAVQSGPPTPQPLIAIAALDALRVDVVVPQGIASMIRTRPTASILIHEGVRVSAAKVTIFPYADPATHTFRVRISLPADTTGLYPGMTVKVAFPLGNADRLLVPASAIVRRGELAGVYVIAPDGSVALRQLRVGHCFGDQLEVLAGLAPGDRVASDPEAATLYLSQRHVSGKAAP